MEQQTFLDAQGRAWPADLTQALTDAALPVHRTLGCLMLVGPGWERLIADFTGELARQSPGAKLICCERDGEGALRLDVSWGESEERPTLLKAYRSRSFLVCEQCGGPARLRHDRPRLSVLCDEHASARDPEGNYCPDLAGGRWRRLLRRV